ncbi:MAG: amidohydrolase family protein [Gammaproteobacteria bacterium]
MTFRKQIINDFHLHLGGSLSRDFLEKTAERNKVKDIFVKLDSIHKNYVESLKNEHKQGAKDLTPIWKQFALVSQIIKTPEDIRLGVIDVVEQSEAIDLEIRTTPKDLDGKGWYSYTEAFIQGLLEANIKFPYRNPRGMLSLDRTVHTLQDAKQIIDYVDADLTGMLVGIDICGNPADKRKLSGKDLAEAISYILDKNMGIAIHLGEIDNSTEREDVNHILIALDHWKSRQKSDASYLNPFHGKVRLGHAIYLTAEQRKKIKDLDLPIEVCPSCHEQLNWSTHNEHPVTKIYPPEEKESTLKVLPGTDDTYIFDCGAILEGERVSSLMKYTLEQRMEIAKQQNIFKFGHFSQNKLYTAKKDHESVKISV